MASPEQIGGACTEQAFQVTRRVLSWVLREMIFSALVEF
jgi:hypothetical protein